MAGNTIPSNKIIIESIHTFADVNKKISGLTDCSLKDFDFLNSTFKDYFHNLQVLSESTTSFINFLTKLGDDPEFEDLKNQKEISGVRIFDTVNFFLSDIKDISEKTNYLTLLVNNLNQDLSTVKLLFTNLKFDPLFNIDLSIVYEQIEVISMCLKQLEDLINNLHYQLNEAIKFTDEGFITSFDLLSEQLENIKGSYQLLYGLSKTASKYHSNLKNLEEKRSSSASEIITNLQFQDILRQKIEHVQDAYDEIINELKKIQTEKSSPKPEELFKIRDITTLQSAQLMHSSQEYQSATETILNKINELNTLLNKFQSIWNHFCKPENTKIQSIKSKLQEHNSLLNAQSFSLFHIAEKFESLTFNLLKQIETLKTKYVDKNNICSSFDILKEQFSNIEKHYSKDKNLGTVMQIKSELSKFDTGFNKLSVEMKKYHNLFHENHFNMQSILKNDLQAIKSYAEKNSRYYGNKLNTLINNLNQGTVNLIAHAEFDVKQVTYYKNFDKEINEIIHLLDNLLSKISVSKNDIDKARLEHLKQLYTMDSERRIHDLITGKKNTNRDNSKKNKDSDEVEFF